MIQVPVIEGGAAMFNQLSYGQKHPGTLQYLQSQFDNVQTFVTEAAQNFMANTRQIFDQYNGAEAMRLARLAMDKVRGVFQRDDVHPIWEVKAFQNAGFVMQRWVMANPMVRERYHQQMCDGYADTYVDMQPGKVGEDHYDYRRVMNGMVKDHPEYDFHVTFYMDELAEGDSELDFDQQVAILNTWDVLEHIVKLEKDDPTSQVGGML